MVHIEHVRNLGGQPPANLPVAPDDFLPWNVEPDPEKGSEEQIVGKAAE